MLRQFLDSFFDQAVSLLCNNNTLYHFLRQFFEDWFVFEKRFLVHFDRPENLIIDLGCGTGALTGCFSPSRYWGVEGDPNRPSFATRRNPTHRFFHSDIFDFLHGPPEIPRRRLVFIPANVLHHVEHERQPLLLKAISAVRAEETRVVIFEPPAEGENMLQRFLLYADRGKMWKTPDDYVKMLERCGFEIERNLAAKKNIHGNRDRGSKPEVPLIPNSSTYNKKSGGERKGGPRRNFVWDRLANIRTHS